MPKTDPDPLGEGFKRGLRAELDRIQPPYSSPRYMSPTHRISPWRLAPAGLAAGVAGILALSFYAATGSPNPAVWTHTIVTKIQPNAPTEASPVSAPSPPQASPAIGSMAPAPPAEHDGPTTSSPRPTERPEPTGSPEPRESPEPTDGQHSGSTSWPSPTAGDH